MTNVPFFANTKDNTHCFQAVLKMILKYFRPQEKYTFTELDKITCKEKGLWTWPMAGELWLVKNGLKVVNIEPFDYKDFAENGYNYLVREFGEEFANEQRIHSKIEKEKDRASELLKIIKVKKEVPTIKDIGRLLNEGYLLIVNVNSVALRKKKGYAGHFILVLGIDDKNITFHNPGGAPGVKYQKVDLETFEKAWAYPNEKAKNIIAIKG